MASISINMREKRIEGKRPKLLSFTKLVFHPIPIRMLHLHGQHFISFPFKRFSIHIMSRHDFDVWTRTIKRPDPDNFRREICNYLHE